MLSSSRAEVLKLVSWPAMWVLATVFIVLAQVFGYPSPTWDIEVEAEAGSRRERPRRSFWPTSCPPTWSAIR
jgi:hypothetical protein